MTACLPAARRTATSLLAALLVVPVASACGSAPAPDQVGADALGGPHAAHTAPVVPAVSAPRTQAATTAVGVRSTLERLLGAHVLLADELVRAALGQDAAQVTATRASVDRNQQELVQAVTSLGSAEIGTQFSTAWKRHVDLLASYATALQSGDTAAAQATRAQYTAAERELGVALFAVVRGQIPLAALTEAATMHGEHLLDHADAQAAGSFDTAASLQRTAFGHMIATADTLARGVAAAKGLPTAELDAPRRRLQSALSRLLAEHMGLMVQAMRAAQDRSPDFGAAGRAVNANTSDLGGAIGLLYGQPASAQFLTIWADHVEALIVYASTQDQAARDQAEERGVDYAPRLARFLAGATEQRLPAIDLAAALTQHDDHLRRQLDAYASDDLDESQAQAEQGYAHMFELSQALATAVGDAVAAKLPQGGAATGGGALAGGH